MSLRYRCDALTNWYMKPLTLGAGHLWVLMSPWGMNVKWYMKCFIYWTADLKSSKLWSSQLWTQFKQLRTEAWKSQDFNGVWTRDLAMSRVQTPLKSWLFQASICNCLNCVHYYDDHSSLDFKSAVQYMKHFMSLHIVLWLWKYSPMIMSSIWPTVVSNFVSARLDLT